MKVRNVLKGWGTILRGNSPFLSIEITRLCPLNCPGCYAYDSSHVSRLGSLKNVADYQGQELIDRVVSLVDRYHPLHVSIIGGEPLLRVRELDVLLPQISARGIAVQIVTSGVVEIPGNWSHIKDLQVVVSIDGLQAEHDLRRTPATYQRILKNISGKSIYVHCVITRQMTGRTDYFERFLRFWSSQAEVDEVWFSFFTPQKDGYNEENLLPAEKREVLHELAGLRSRFPKLYLPDPVIKGYLNPPSSPENCMFAGTTLTLTADLYTTITPCQFGGDPDCCQCGCMAAAGLKAVGDFRLLGIVPLHSIFKYSRRAGQIAAKKRETGQPVYPNV